ncbi:AAA family ATPase [Pseudonocardia sp. ICBG1293]|uniref:AAA family ATPase n=1 Tax=Pseudonocardia sp. ICBG1293 TaxID=2844382 RepID=UPI001CCDFAB6|nr:AAA family ATPase [Pseudonocardia sp. ICBG1293]
MPVARSTTDTVLELVGADGGPPVVLLTGHAGSGRSTVLAQVGAALHAEGRAVIAARLSRDGVTTGMHDGSGAPLARGGGPVPVPLGPVAGAHRDPGVARRAAAATAAWMTGRDAVVLLDDVQWMDLDTLAVLDALAHRLAGSTVRYVCAVALPFPAHLAEAGSAALARLREQSLLASVRVPALDAGQAAQVVQEVLGAVPSTELLTWVRDHSRGLAAVVAAAAATLLHGGGVRLVYGYAYLLPGADQDPPPETAAALQERIRRLGSRMWSTAQLAAALEPAGAALPELLATAAGTDQQDALDGLSELRAAGILHVGGDRRWRFVVPLLGAALRTTLGPYRRSELAALLVGAAWDGRVTPDRFGLADQVVLAGRLLPADRAYAELVSAGTHARPDHVRREQRWWQAATEAAPTASDRLRARHEFTRAAEQSGDIVTTIDSIRGLLEDGTTPRITRHALYLRLVLCLHSAEETEELDAIASGSAPSLWKADDGIRAVCQVLARAVRGRWADACATLRTTRELWMGEPTTHAVGELTGWSADLLAGRASPESAVAVVQNEADPIGVRYRATWAISTLVEMGDVPAARRVARRAGFAEYELLPRHRAVFALLEGRPEAPELARRAIAHPGALSFEISAAAFHQQFAGLMVMRGQLTGAREMAAAARAEVTVLTHVLDVVDAAGDAVLGDLDAAAARADRALTRAREEDLLVGTDLLLVLLLETDLVRGDDETARRRSRELDTVAETLGTPRAVLHATFGRALVHRDTATAEETLHIARQTGQAFDGAQLGRRLARLGLLGEEDLLGVYDFYDRIDAPLARYWTRAAMEASGVPVPGRAITKAENERLLGQLLTEGLTNRQIAHILDSTEKSVEGRLGRLFARTGYRSRIELAAALLDRTFEH